MKNKRALQITLGLGRTVGGGEYTALIIAELLKELGFNVTLLCKRMPNSRKYLEAFGVEFPFDEIAIFRYPKLPKIFRLYHYLIYPLSTPNIYADLYFNTSADSHPFVFPISAILDYKPIVYYVTALPLTPPWHIRDSIKESGIGARELYRSIFSLLAEIYWKKLNAFFIACSKYVAKIMNECLGVSPEILYTPVDVEKYLWRNEEKEDYAVVMGRLDPSKRYEDAILACKKAGVKLVMLLAMQNKQYYRQILKLIKQHDLDDKVQIILNAPIEVRSRILRKAKVFIHCRIEAGAKAVREAMAAGCIPIVPAEGGQSEFVPKEFTYLNIDELPQKIREAMTAGPRLRRYIVEESKKHDKQFFKRKLKEILFSALLC